MDTLHNLEPVAINIYNVIILPGGLPRRASFLRMALLFPRNNKVSKVGPDGAGRGELSRRAAAAPHATASG